MVLVLVLNVVGKTFGSAKDKRYCTELIMNPNWKILPQCLL